MYNVYVVYVIKLCGKQHPHCRVCRPDVFAKLNAANRGRVFSPEHRAKLSASHMGKKHSIEAIDKIRTAKMGDKNPMFGRIGSSNPSYKHGLNRTPADFAARRHRRRARKVNNGGSATAEELKMLPDFCVYCFAKDNLTVDHIIPLVKGGAGSIENLTTACVKCNLSKGTKLLKEWLLCT